MGGFVVGVAAGPVRERGCGLCWLVYEVLEARFVVMPSL